MLLKRHYSQPPKKPKGNKQRNHRGMGMSNNITSENCLTIDGFKLDAVIIDRNDYDSDEEFCLAGASLAMEQITAYRKLEGVQSEQHINA